MSMQSVAQIDAGQNGIDIRLQYGDAQLKDRQQRYKDKRQPSAPETQIVHKAGDDFQHDMPKQQRSGKMPSRPKKSDPAI